jgi:ribonuclease HI
MTKPQSLVAKLYKARYFLNSSLFETKIGHNPSYTWRGIWKVREVLMHGCRWSIGNGSNIKLMGDPWLRGEDGAWLPSPQNQGVYNLYVNDILTPNIKRWDKRKIESLFPMNIANRIMETPLLSVVEEDKIVWLDNNDGNYSVRSGYKMLMHVSGRSRTVTDNEAWQCLWKIKAPPKAKHLLWRICKGCLPTRMRLQEKHVPCQLSCPLCEHTIEDDWHVFAVCNVTVQACQAAGIDSMVAQYFQQAANIKELILHICKNESDGTAGVFAMLMWILWQNRNNMVWNNTHESGRVLGLKARYFWEEWHAVQELNHNQHRASQQLHANRWEKPQQGWYKCNVDAAFHKDSNRTSTAWCLRDHLGRFVAAETTWLEGIYSVVEGEAMALLEAMRAMEQRRISHVIFETDSKSMVDAVLHFHRGNSEFSMLVSLINNMLAFDQNFMVRFIKRQANMAAHSLARAAISWASRCHFETLPICISDLLINEMV